MLCGACGSEYTSKDVFCMECGLKLPDREKPTPAERRGKRPNKTSLYGKGEIQPKIRPELELLRGGVITPEEARKMIDFYEPLTPDERDLILAAVPPANAKAKILANKEWSDIVARSYARAAAQQATMERDVEDMKFEALMDTISLAFGLPTEDDLPELKQPPPQPPAKLKTIHGRRKKPPKEPPAKLIEPITFREMFAHFNHNPFIGLLTATTIFLLALFLLQYR